MSKWLVVAVVVVLGAGCNYGAGAFRCALSTDCTGGPGGTCEPNGSCSFTDTTCDSGRRYGDLSRDVSGICVGDEPQDDAGIDSPPDARVCFGSGLLNICLATAPTAPLTISTTTTTAIDTDTSSMCATVTSGGSNYCVLAGTTITIEKLRATGTKPLVLIASDSITTSGLIDVGSHRADSPETGAGADPAACTTMAGTAPTNGGGGAGGSFTGAGGAGGASANTGSSGGAPGMAAVSVTELRGGCPGQDGEGMNKGTGGHGGGAVFLIAGNTINVGGGINAAGEGGRAGTQSTSGGGGGGAGGMIGLDAPIVMGNSLLLANGGGGGEGSGVTTAGVSGSDPSGINAANGGNGGISNGGDGGNGSAGAAGGPGAEGAAGSTVSGNRGGGGGGGGGAGLIKAPTGATLGTQISPPATP